MNTEFFVDKNGLKISSSQKYYDEYGQEIMFKWDKAWERWKVVYSTEPNKCYLLCDSNFYKS